MKFVLVRSEAVADDGQVSGDDDASISLSRLGEESRSWFGAGESAQVATSPDVRAFQVASAIGQALRQDRSVALVRVGALGESDGNGAVDAERMQQELDWLSRRGLSTVLVASGAAAALIDSMMPPSPDGEASVTQQMDWPTREYTL